MHVHQAEVFKTDRGTPYLKSCGIALLAVPTFQPEAVRPFIEGFETFNTDDYVNDFYRGTDDFKDRRITGLSPLKLDDGASLVKFSGQMCYLSLGEKRTRNDEGQKYIDHIKESSHGSVLEHANYSFLFWGIDRSVTHELVRHRAGFAYSQVSQRYVSGKTLRFVERPEYQSDLMLHKLFEERIDAARSAYDHVADVLQTRMAEKLATMAKTDARKAVNQTARSGLPNETEAPIVVTGNARAWRHFIEMRASKYAETTIQRLASFTCNILQQVSPLIFSDYKQADDSPFAVETKYRKV